MAELMGVCGVSCQADERFKLSAVTSGNIAATLYNQVKNNDPRIQEPEGLNFDDKTELCQYIIGSNYYKYVSGDILVNKHHPMYNKLQEKNSSIEAIGLVKTQLTVKEVLHFNPTILVKVFSNRTDEEPFSENIFSCLTVDPPFSRDSVFLYYVSPEYNLNDSLSPPMKGRFIFNLQGEAENVVLEVSSFAEEPAKPLSKVGAEAERLYLEKRAGHKPTTSESEDPLCSLTQEERIHACTKVLSSTYFEKAANYMYAPPHDPFDSEYDDSDSDEPSVAGRSRIARSIEFFMNQPISKRVYKLAHDLSDLIIEKLRTKSADKPNVSGLTDLINETADDSAAAKPAEKSVDESTEKLEKHEGKPDVENLDDKPTNKPADKSVVAKSIESMKKFSQPVHKLADDLTKLILQNLTRKSNADMGLDSSVMVDKSETIENIHERPVGEPMDTSETVEEPVAEPCKCVKNRIVFQDKDVRQQKEVLAGKWEEWMISCKSSVPNKTEFFLSRAYNSDHQVFAYRLFEDFESELIDSDPEIANTVVVENMFGDIRLKIRN